jgi:hypothetical protein
VSQTWSMGENKNSASSVEGVIDVSKFSVQLSATTAVDNCETCIKVSCSHIIS